MSPQSLPNSRLVYSVFHHGLVLKERLRFGGFNMAQEQGELKRLVRTAEAAGPPETTGSPGDRYLGVGYPLVCWLDEVFILDPRSPWRKEWQETTLRSCPVW